MPRKLLAHTLLDNLEPHESGCLTFRLARGASVFRFNGRELRLRRIAYLCQSDKPLSSEEIVSQLPTCTVEHCCNIKHLVVSRRQHKSEYMTDVIFQLKEQLK